MSNCSNTPFSFDAQLFYSNECFTCSGDCGNNVQNSQCVVYTGPNLSCSGIETNDTVEVALQKIDEQICSVIGDYSNYQFNCLIEWWGEEITQESEFVDAITAYACEITENLESFTGVTFPSYQSSVTAQFEAITGPQITCSAAGVTSSDSLEEVLEKYCEKFEDIDTSLDISGVNWDQCFVVVDPPTNLSEAFSLVIDQICEVNDTAGELPTFNNTGSCLTGGGATDSLVTTIGLIKTRLCQSPTWDSDNVTWGCVTEPGDDQDIEEAIQNIVTSVNTLTQNYTAFDEDDFVVTATDPEDPCAGVTISLATPVNQDRLVAVNADDVSPGTLVAKLSSAGSIELDDSSDTTMEINVFSKDYGDITVSSNGNTWTIDNDVVTFAKMQNINTGALLGRSTASSGDVEQITVGSGLSLTSGVLSATAATLDSGTYDPVLSNTTNITSSTTATCQYLRVGNVVTVSGMVTVTATTETLQSDLGVSLPIASTIANINEVGGTGAIMNGSTSESENVAIYGNTSASRATFSFIAPVDSTPIKIHFSFTYLVVDL